MTIQISKLMRNLLIAGGAVLVIAAGALALSPTARESLACKESLEVQFSPGGKYRAQMIEKTCHPGLAQASDTVEVKVELQDKPGLFINVPLEYSGFVNPAPPSPSLKWKNANTLEVTVYSNDLTGTLVRRVDNLTVMSHYVKAPKARAGAGKPA
jgi:hypothetical protein